MEVGMEFHIAGDLITAVFYLYPLHVVSLHRNITPIFLLIPLSKILTLHFSQFWDDDAVTKVVFCIVCH